MFPSLLILRILPGTWKAKGLVPSCPRSKPQDPEASGLESGPESILKTKPISVLQDLEDVEDFDYFADLAEGDDCEASTSLRCESAAF